MSLPVEELAASLVREYLSRKGFKRTLLTMDEEYPRSPTSISNRVLLAKAVHIEKLMKGNKEHSNPLRTMIEVVVRYMLEKIPSSATSISSASSTSYSTSSAISCPIEPTPQPHTGRHTLQSSINTNKMVSVAAPPPPAKTVVEEECKKNGSPTTMKIVAENEANKNGSPTTTRIVAENEVDTPNRSDVQKIMSDALDAGKLNSVSNGGDFTISTAMSRRAKLPSDPKVSKRSSQPPPTFREWGENPPVSRGIALKNRRFRPKSVAEWEREQERKRIERGKSRNKTFVDYRAREKGEGREKEGSSRKGRIVGEMEVGEIETERGGARSTVEADKGMKMGEGGKKTKYADRSKTGLEATPTSMRHWHSAGDVDTVTGSCRENLALRSNHQMVAHSEDSYDLLYEDLEEQDDDPMSGTLAAASEPPPTSGPGFLQTAISGGQPMPRTTAKALQEILFGSSRTTSFNSEWKRQNFSFCDLRGLEYGLLQHKGGPCGVLASVQAYILKHLLFSTTNTSSAATTTSTDSASADTPSHRLQPSPEERDSALISALVDIVWKAGGSNGATVVLPALRTHGAHTSRSHSHNTLIERSILHTFNEISTLRLFLQSHLYIFQSDEGSGCIYFLLSCLLSKGLDDLREDMDDKKSALIGTHGYCTQELVNLLLTGRVVSNTFDGNLDLEMHALKGLSERSEIGFLSLFEHYNSCIVGSHYKEPIYPLWVICSESHFSVLFSLENKLATKWEMKNKFDLFYYDGLANQDEVIRLTIDSHTQSSPATTNEVKSGVVSLISPLELCIRTKWKSAVVNWNSTDPLL